MKALRLGLMAAWLCGIIGLILLVIAVNTDHWVLFDVMEIPEIRVPYRGYPYAYDRSMGLFRECFTGDFPPPIDVAYSTAFGYKCLNMIGRWLYPRSEISEIIQVKIHSQTVWAHLITGGIGILALLVALTVGFAAWCVNFPSCLILATGTTFVISLILFCTSMGLWHAAKFMRQDSIQLDGYYANWPSVIKDNTETQYDWSYLIVWAGVAAVLVACLLQLVCYCIAKSNTEDERNQKLMSYYKRKNLRHKFLSSSRKPEDSSIEEDPASVANSYKPYLASGRACDQGARRHDLPRRHRGRQKEYPKDPLDIRGEFGGNRSDSSKNDHKTPTVAVGNPTVATISNGVNYNSNFSNYSPTTNGLTADDKSTLVSPPTIPAYHEQGNGVQLNNNSQSQTYHDYLQHKQHKNKKRRKHRGGDHPEPSGVGASPWDDSVHDKSKHGPKPVRNPEMGDLENGVAIGSNPTGLSAKGGRTGSRRS